MPVKQLRRLSPNVRTTLYDEIEQHTLSASWGRRELDAVEHQHPELVLRRGANILAGVPAAGGIAYAFESERSFIELFPPMFEELLPRMRRAGIDVARFRLTHNPARPVVEPVLKGQWFAASRSWLQFSLDKTGAIKPPPVRGIKFRDGGPQDVDAILRVDRESFPNTPLPRDTMESRLQTSRVLLAVQKDDLAGFAIYDEPVDGSGYLFVLAVAPEFRGRGVGGALTLRVAITEFSAGAHRLDLKTDDDNAEAIRLYARLGFKQTAAGRDYSRPTDPRVIARNKKTSEGTVIRFGGWR